MNTYYSSRAGVYSSRAGARAWQPKPRTAAEAAHDGRSRPCMAAEAAATRRAPSFPSARRPPPLRRMLPRPTGQSCLCTAGDSRNELLTQMQLHNHLCPSSARSAHFSHPCIPSRYHRNPLRACDISVQEFVV